jgi:hypothetical protein
VLGVEAIPLMILFESSMLLISRVDQLFVI